MRVLVQGGIYRHFKGKLYMPLYVAEHTETGEKLVVYMALYGNNEIWAKPYDMFMSKVDREKYPDADQEYRMELIPREISHEEA